MAGCRKSFAATSLKVIAVRSGSVGRTVRTVLDIIRRSTVGCKRHYVIVFHPTVSLNSTTGATRCVRYTNFRLALVRCIY